MRLETVLLWTNVTLVGGTYQKEGAIGLAADSAREQLSFTI